MYLPSYIYSDLHKFISFMQIIIYSLKTVRYVPSTYKHFIKSILLNSCKCISMKLFKNKLFKNKCIFLRHVLRNIHLFFLEKIKKIRSPGSKSKKKNDDKRGKII